VAGVTLSTFSLFAVPGAIYAIQNSLIFYALVYLEAPTFQVVASLKIVTTAILFRIILRKVLTTVQWIALLQLFLSMVITKMGALLSPQQSQDRQNLLIGAGILFVNAWLSATSGICNEWLVKYQDAKAPLMLKSIQLYFWGTLVNLIAWVVTDTNEMSLSSQVESALPHTYISAPPSPPPNRTIIIVIMLFIYRPLHSLYPVICLLFVMIRASVPSLYASSSIMRPWGSQWPLL